MTASIGSRSSTGGSIAPAIPFAASITTRSGLIASTSTKESTFSTNPGQMSFGVHLAALGRRPERLQRAVAYVQQARLAAHRQRTAADDLHPGVLLRVVRCGDAHATVEPELADRVVDHLGADHPEVEDVRAAVSGAVDQRSRHRRRRDAHVAADRDAARLEVLDVRAADRVRALLVQLVRIDAADVVGLEDAGIEHGLTLAEAPARAAEQAPRNYNHRVERKLATVLFVDLVGSTELVAARDPEIVRRRVNSFFEHVSHCITMHGGIVEKFAGDAVMAAFGVPKAHEDDAERAIRAAVAILDSVARSRARGADRGRGGRGRGGRVGLDVRNRRGGERRCATAAARRAGGDPDRPVCAPPDAVGVETEEGGSSS